MDQACRNTEPIFVKRKNGENIVIISEAEYLSLDETAYLLQNKTNRQHLANSLRDLENNQTESFSLSEL
jgi:antitoxin YefM